MKRRSIQINLDAVKKREKLSRHRKNKNLYKNKESGKMSDVIERKELYITAV